MGYFYVFRHNFKKLDMDTNITHNWIFEFYMYVTQCEGLLSKWI